MLQSMGLQRVRHNLATEQQQIGLTKRMEKCTNKGWSSYINIRQSKLQSREKSQEANNITE